MHKNILTVVGITILFLGMSITPSVAIDIIKKSSISISNGNTLYVGGTGPGNYSKIQDAIDNASDEDTVFVYNGTYYENLVLDKSINLLGFDKDTTIIDGGEKGDVFYVYTDVGNWTIGGFTIQNGGDGIDLKDSSYNTIIGNNFFNNGVAINFWDSIKNVISGNNISDNGGGIEFLSCNNNIISDNSFFDSGLQIRYSFQNIISNNTVNGKPLVYMEDVSDNVLNVEAGQIILVNCDNIIIQNQEISNTTIGIELWNSTKCLISGNTISYNHYGILLFYCSNYNTIRGNNVRNNLWGIRLDDWCNRNTITHNTISWNHIGGISLFHVCKLNSITRNIIHGSRHDVWGSGINLGYANHNTVSQNIIYDNKFGISLEGKYNVISHNHIENNFKSGIFIEFSSFNVVKKNNFIENECNANFEVYFLPFFSITRWRNNYWDDWRGFGLYRIEGVIFLPNPSDEFELIEIPWFRFDWHPAQEPYDIEV